MTIGSIFLGLALLILVGLFIARPLMVREQRRQRRPSSRRVLETQKEALLAKIRILDLDFETGKMPEAVYEPQRAQLMAEATAILQQLDELGASTQAAEMVAGAGPADADAAIEAAIAARREGVPIPQTTQSAPMPQAASHASDTGPADADTAIEAAIAARREKATVPETARPAPMPTKAAPQASNGRDSTGRAQYCPQCGQPTDADDKFCSHCGHRLSQKQPA